MLSQFGELDGRVAVDDVERMLLYRTLDRKQEILFCRSYIASDYDKLRVEQVDQTCNRPS